MFVFILKNVGLFLYFVFVAGKAFLNTFEYLDLKTNEWTTFIPKGSCEILLKKKPRSRRNSRKSVSEDKKSLTSPTKNDNIIEQAVETIMATQQTVQS